MPKPEELKRDRYQIIIYHGHIHILSTHEEIEDNKDINEIKNYKKSFISEI
ncbi:MAG: hypothetical protein ACFFG0_33485 [Candidatus Thorarchaeota archaeon]